jgi:hypothetical protein
MRWNLNVDLICVSFKARDVEHFFMCFLPFGLLLLKISVQFNCSFLLWVIDSLEV